MILTELERRKKNKEKSNDNELNLFYDTLRQTIKGHCVIIRQDRHVTPSAAG